MCERDKKEQTIIWTEKHNLETEGPKRKKMRDNNKKRDQNSGGEKLN